MTEVTRILVAAMSPDAALRVPAEAAIEAAKQSDLAGFLLALIGEFRNEQNDGAARQMALICLKNSIALDAKDEERKTLLEQRWRSIPAEVKHHVKTEALATLASPEHQVRFTAALMIANLARVELPMQQWPDLIQILCTAAAATNLQHVEAALTTLGYICEECDHSDALNKSMQVYSHDVLTAIFSGVARESEEVRYYSVNALCNAMDFIEANMAQLEQQQFIMQAIIQLAGAPADARAAQFSSSRVRQKAIECLSRVGALYYEHTQPYMQSIYVLTVAAIRDRDQKVALQALEFWMTVFDTEKTMMGRGETTKGYADFIKADLFGVIGECLMKQEEEQTEDDWNVSVASSKALQYLAEAVGDGIVPVVMPYVQQHIGAANWREQEAALVAFGCILVGPDPKALETIVAACVEGLLAFADVANRHHTLVRDTAAWVMCVVANEFSEAFLEPTVLPRLFNIVGPMLNEKASMAERACAVIHNLAHYYDDDEEEDGKAVETTALSPYFNDIVTALFTTIDRPDKTDNLVSNAQEAINMVINACALDTLGVLDNLVPQIVTRLAGLAGMRAASSSVEMAIGLFCGSLNSVCKKLDHRMARHYPSVMEAMLALAAVQSDGSVGQEALLTIASLARACPEMYGAYEARVLQIVEFALKQTDDFDLCAVAIGTIGDICAALQQKAAAVTVPGIMPIFDAHLRSAEIDRDIQISCVHCLGDIALNIGCDAFTPYAAGVITTVTGMLAQSYTMNHAQDDDAFEYCCSLWEAAGHLFTSLLQAHKRRIDAILPHTALILSFINTVLPLVKEENETYIKVLSVVGDLANVVVASGRKDVAAAAKGQLMTSFVDQALKFASQSPDEEMKETATWVTTELQALSRAR